MVTRPFLIVGLVLAAGLASPAPGVGPCDVRGAVDPDGRLSAVVDRIEAGDAVLVVDAPTPVERLLPVRCLPAAARRPDAVLWFDVGPDGVGRLRYDAAATEARAARAQRRFDRLVARPPETSAFLC